MRKSDVIMKMMNRLTDNGVEMKQTEGDSFHFICKE